MSRQDIPVESLVTVISAVLVLLYRQTHTDADERFTPATLIGMSNDRRYDTDV